MIMQEARSSKDSDFRSVVDAAAENWYTQRSISPSLTPSGYVNGESKSLSHSRAGPGDSTESIGNSITAWESALKSLPEDFRDMPLSIHALPQSLAKHPAIRKIEWNSYRPMGGFVPRTPHDFASLMIYVSGQVSPNPCRRCILKQGPFARCIVSPPMVLAQSQLKHACANCTYQNQYKKCTNEPVTEAELARLDAMRNSWAWQGKLGSKSKGRGITATTVSDTTKTRPGRGLSGVRKRTQQKKSNYHYVVQKPSAQSITADSFADKLQQIRSWSPCSRRLMKAEIMQWQAALATVEAERTLAVAQPPTASQAHKPARSPVYDNQRVPSPSTVSTAMPASHGEPIPNTNGTQRGWVRVEEGSEAGDDIDVVEDSQADYDHYEGPSWVGFDDDALPIRPPLL